MSAALVAAMDLAAALDAALAERDRAREVAVCLEQELAAVTAELGTSRHAVSGSEASGSRRGERPADGTSRPSPLMACQETPMPAEAPHAIDPATTG